MTARKGTAHAWIMVVAVAAIVNVGYGTIFYSFGVLLGEGAAAGEFGRGTLSAAFGAGVVVSAALALPVGALCDAKGPRRVFLFGAVAGAAGLAAFSQAATAWQIIAVWALLLGPAMACVFYEPAYVAVDQWFDGPKGKPIGVLTVVAGLSATVFVPLTQWLVEREGWRGATLTLGAVLLAVVGSLSLLVVRNRPRPGARMERMGPKAARAAILEGLGRADRAFWLVSAAFFLALTATWAMLFHQVAYMQDLGFPAGGVAAAVGFSGAVSLPARFLLPALGDRVSPTALAAATFGVLALSGLVLLGAQEWWRVYVYVGLFGVAFGSVLPLRALVMSRRFGGALYGRLMGLQQTGLALAMAVGPFAAGALRDATGSYHVPWLGAVALFVAAVPAILAVRAASPRG
ncbi:MAG: MFS transporter [Actinomycetota bacterium]|nr:MFS transporter [Actinomycetota bacterium]